MRVSADLHVHSRFSLATSPRMGLAEIARAARRKGIDLVGTGDCTNPGWLSEVRRALRHVGDGVYEADGVRFILTGEVAAVWRNGGRGRRVHVLVLVPTIEEASAVGRVLSRWGNLASDGRPTLAAAAGDVADLVWSASPRAEVIPAHVWTPWCSALGRRSGFDSIGECFGPASERIAAVETGLSSDPAMCRRVSALDRLALVSFSDAHSPEGIGREATIFDLEEVSFPALSAALSRGTGARTVEVFPEEGKYYHDGHRKCGVSISPAEARAIDARCPQCGGRLTEGVLHRIDDLADRAKPVGTPAFDSVIPLREIVAALLGRRPQARAVAVGVDEVITRFGPELGILLDRPIEELRLGACGGALSRLADAVDDMRRQRVVRVAGYDGVMGEIRPLCLAG